MVRANVSGFLRWAAVAALAFACVVLSGGSALAPVYRADQLQVFVYLNSALANSVGYSGKPIHILVGIDPKGVITVIKLVDHKEPIVLVGIPEARIVGALNSLIGKDMKPVA